MTTSEAIRSLVHVVGPIEREPDDSPLGFTLVQRCLRCDELLGVWPDRPEPPERTYPVGTRVGADAYEGVATRRYVIVDRALASDEWPCEPTPVALL